jgi:transposase
MNKKLENNDEKELDYVVVSDNASIHKAKHIRWFLDEFEIPQLIISPYSPCLISAEKFTGTLKGKIKAKIGLRK